MNKFTLLYKDGSVGVSSKLKHFTKIKYILVPLNDLNNSFICIRPCEYMKKFHHAIVSFSLMITRYSSITFFDESEIKLTPLQEISNEFHTLIDFFRYLHSINRIRYYNKISNSNESIEYDLIDFTSIQIQIFDQKECVYHYSFKVKYPEAFGSSDILSKINEIWIPESFDLPLIISGNKWKLENVRGNTLIGLSLPLIKLITFVNAQDLSMLYDIKSFFVVNFTYNPYHDSINEIDIDLIQEYHFQSGSLRYHDLWCHTTNDIVEYIIALPFLYQNAIFASEIIDFQEITDTMECKTKISITKYTSDMNDVRTYELEMESTNNEILSLYQFIKLLVEEGGIYENRINIK